MTTSWTVMPQWDGDDLIVTLPDELIEKLGWKEGDDIHYDIKDGQCYVTNKSADKRKADGSSTDTSK